jgi:hypothetical protein
METLHAPQGAANYCRIFLSLPQPGAARTNWMTEGFRRTMEGGLRSFPLWQDRRAPEKVIIAASLKALSDGR